MDDIRAKKPLNPPLKVALIGAGGIAEEHVQSLARIPQTRLTAVCDLSMPRASKLAARFGIPAAYSSVRELMERDKPDAVHILTPPQSHIPVALECVRAGCHVFVEKPLGLSRAGCLDLKQAAERNQVRVGVNHNVAFRPAFQELVGLIRDRRLGRLQHVFVAYSVSPLSIGFRDPSLFLFHEPDSVVFELGPHPFSLVRRLMGAPKQVAALRGGHMEVAGGKSFYASWQTCWVTERGTAQVFLSVGKGHPDITVAAYGEDAVAYADVVHHTVRIYENTDRLVHGKLVQGLRNARAGVRGTLMPILSRFGKAIRRPENPGLHSMLPSVAAFYDALLKGTKPPESIEEAMEVVQFCEMARESARAGSHATAAAGGF